MRVGPIRIGLLAFRTIGEVLGSSAGYVERAVVVAFLAVVLAACQGTIVPSSSERGPSGPRTSGRGPASERVPDPSCSATQVAVTPTAHLTAREYRRTVADLLGTEPSDLVFAADEEAGGFDVGTGISALLVDQYVDAAEGLARSAVEGDLSRLVPCSSAPSDRSCASDFVASFGSRAFRRPLTVEEQEAYLSVFDVGAEHDFPSGIEAVVFAMLASPHFLYHVEESAEAANPGETVALGPYALANRLSYFLWGTMPDDPLFSAAASGALDEAGLEVQARRMLDDPRALEGLRAFAHQWLELEQLEGLVKDAALYPRFEPQTPSRMQASIDAFVDEAFRGATPTLEGLFGSSAVYADAELATLWGLPAISPPGLQRIDADPIRRSGLITQPALLAAMAKPEASDPIHRGLFVRERLFCQSLLPPPADLMVTVPQPTPGLSTRDRFAQHSTDPACRGCHELIDPLGFGFEHYDAVGRWREDEDGLAVDAAGEVRGTEDADGGFQGAIELAERLAGSQQVTECVALQWFRYAAGRVETEFDQCSVGQMQREFASAGYDLRELMIAVVRTDAFRNYVVPEGVTDG